MFFMSNNLALSDVKEYSPDMSNVTRVYCRNAGILETQELGAVFRTGFMRLHTGKAATDGIGICETEAFWPSF